MSNIEFSKKVALRYLWSRRGEAFITILTIISIVGVALGVTVLNITMAIMTGFESELKEKIVGANSHIVVRQVSGSFGEWEKIKDRLEKLEEVTSVAPFTYNQALLKVDTKSVGILIRGITPQSGSTHELDTYTKQFPTATTDLFHPKPVEIMNEDGATELIELPGILVGKELSRTYGLVSGQVISLLSSNVTSTPLGLVPKFRRFVVVGTYNSGLVEYESGVAYVALSEAQKFFKLGFAVNGLEVRIKHLDQSAMVTSKIMAALNEFEGQFYAQDWTEQNKPLWEAIKLEKRVYFIVLLLLVVLASFSIISTLVMIVLEKRKDIAVLKTLGATDKSVRRIFQLQGAVIGALGTSAGLVMAYVGCKILQVYGFPLDERIFQMSQVPIRIVPLNFFIVGLASFVICLLATLYPAKRASSLHPSEVLRS